MSKEEDVGASGEKRQAYNRMPRRLLAQKMVICTSAWRLCWAQGPVTAPGGDRAVRGWRAGTHFPPHAFHTHCIAYLLQRVRNISSHFFTVQWRGGRCGGRIRHCSPDKHRTFLKRKGHVAGLGFCRSRQTVLSSKKP